MMLGILDFRKKHLIMSVVETFGFTLCLAFRCSFKCRLCVVVRCGASEKEEKEAFCDVSTTGGYVNRVCRNPTLSGSYELIGTERGTVWCTGMVYVVCTYIYIYSVYIKKVDHLEHRGLLVASISCDLRDAPLTFACCCCMGTALLRQKQQTIRIGSR
jgi:hypothetical protein